MRPGVIVFATSFVLVACNKTDETENTIATNVDPPANLAEASSDEKLPTAHGSSPGGEILGEAARGTDQAAAGPAEAPGNSDRSGAGAAAADPHGTDAADGGEKAEPVDPLVPLFTEVKKRRTKDKRALAALAEAEKLGAESRALANAAYARAKALFANPERAKAFFEWAADKDKTFPDPVFDLARQAVMSGDIPTTKELLTEVRKRKGGKKLLQQLDFDPTWDIVKDDSDIRGLMK